MTINLCLGLYIKNYILGNYLLKTQLSIVHSYYLALLVGIKTRETDNSKIRKNNNVTLYLLNTVRQNGDIQYIQLILIVLIEHSPLKG